MATKPAKMQTGPAEPTTSVRYRAWLVDLDGTLYRGWGVRLAMGLQLVARGGGALRVIRAFRSQHELLRHSEETAGDPFAIQIERTAQALGVSAERVEQLVAEWMIERPAVWLRMFRRRRLLDEIRAFRSAGGRTAIVSDYPAAGKLQAMGVAELFDIVVASGEPGGPQRLKPDPHGYLLAAERLGIAARECLVLGDREDADGAAARAAGMAFRLIRRG